MHIRHDWQTWVEWPYKHVSTVCGMKVVRHNAGIPGITNSEVIINNQFAWCPVCCGSVKRQIENASKEVGNSINAEISKFYQAAWIIVDTIYAKNKENWDKKISSFRKDFGVV